MPWEIRAGSVLVVGSGANQENVVVTAVDPATNPKAFQARFLKNHAVGTPITVITAGLSVPGGDRVPGKVNLNTIWDPETLLALCDPQAANSFTTRDVGDVFLKLMRSRSPGYNFLAGTGGPGPFDRPFKGMGVGFSRRHDPATNPNPQHPLFDAGIDDTFLRPDPDDPTRRLFEARPTERIHTKKKKKREKKKKKKKKTSPIAWTCRRRAPSAGGSRNWRAAASSPAAATARIAPPRLSFASRWPCS